MGIFLIVLSVAFGCFYFFKDKKDRGDVPEAAMGCGLSYAEAEALDEDEARFCLKRRLNADMKERARCDVISGGACVNP